MAGFYCNLSEECIHSYDMIESPMADDTIWDYVQDYFAGSILSASKVQISDVLNFVQSNHRL